METSAGHPFGWIITAQPQLELLGLNRLHNRDEESVYGREKRRRLLDGTVRVDAKEFPGRRADRKGTPPFVA